MFPCPRVLRTLRFFGDAQGALVQHQSFVIWAHGVVKRGQVIQPDAGAAVLGAFGLFRDGQAAQIQGQGLVMLAHGPIQTG